MYACSPKWGSDWISENDLETLFFQLAGRIKPSPWGREGISLNHGLHFTGGEPFLNFELLQKAVEIAEDLGIPSTFVETNCHWCKDDKMTRDRLGLLRDRGLKGIVISVNPFYLEYVPFERSERCIRISSEVFGRNLMVYQLEYYRQFAKLGIRGRVSLGDYLKLSKGEDLGARVELFLMGRGARGLREFYPKYTANAFFREPCTPVFLRNWHNHFDNYGNIMPGYCGGISLGRWKDLDMLLKDGIDLDTHPVLAFLIKEDIDGLFHYASEFDYQESREGYVSKCDLCLDIRKYLCTVKDFVELNPGEFYAHLV